MTGDLRIDRRLAAPPSALWDACSTPRGLEGWFADKVSGTVGVGQTVRLEWPGLRASVAADVAELVVGKRIAFRNGATRVAVEIREDQVSLTHSGLAPGDDRAGFGASWRVALSMLSHGLERHPGSRRRALWFRASARTTAELAHLYYSDSQGLGAWLGTGRSLGEEGQEYSLVSFGGEPMSGRVLVRDGGRDVAISWREQGDSVLVMRSLPVPASPFGRVLAVCWSRWVRPGATDVDAAAVTRVAGELERSVGRLARALDRSGIA